MGAGTEQREPLSPSAAEVDEAAYWARLYGRWDPMDLPAASAVLAGFGRPWWVVGGWAIDAFAGTPREHDDIDISIFSSDVPALRAHLGDRWQLWNQANGDMRPLTDRHPDIFEPASQLWVREHGDAPWVIDLPLTPDVEGLWTNKFLPGHAKPLESVTWVACDGVRYLSPEIVLFFKAHLRRTKDERDLRLVVPMLGDEQRRWLRWAIARGYDDQHPWLHDLTG